MKITEHNNLIQLTRLWAFNCYLVREADSLTVIDTNLPGSANGIYKAAQQYNLPITHIVLTHAHSDHVASADELHKLVPDAEVIISERDAPFLRGDMTLLPDEPQDKLRGGYTQIETEPTRTVNDGDMIGSLRVVAAPGHTPGHIALLDTRDNTLIAGDAYVTQFGIVVSGKLKLAFPFPAMATWHKPTALDTARNLLNIEPTRLAVGHGPVLNNPKSQMTMALQTAEQAFGN